MITRRELLFLVELFFGTLAGIGIGSDGQIAVGAVVGVEIDGVLGVLKLEVGEVPCPIAEDFEVDYVVFSRMLPSDEVGKGLDAKDCSTFGHTIAKDNATRILVRDKPRGECF